MNDDVRTKKRAIYNNAPKPALYVVGLCIAKRTLKRPAVNAIWKIAEES